LTHRNKQKTIIMTIAEKAHALLNGLMTPVEMAQVLNESFGETVADKFLKNALAEHHVSAFDGIPFSACFDFSKCKQGMSTEQWLDIFNWFQTVDTFCNQDKK
jgi:hypothetical protein